MYRAKLSLSSKEQEKFNTICTLQDNQKPDSASYLINGKDVVKADQLLDSIFGKLNLMYSVRQSYSMEGIHWKFKESEFLVKCLTIYSGSEAVNILIQVENDEILERIFPDFQQESKIKFIELKEEFDTDGTRKYFDIIVKTVKLNL